jgi:hypothetical protein
VLDETRYFGIYRNDGIAAFPGTWMQTEVENWLLAFQRTINDKEGNNKLSFTAEVWTPGRDKTTKQGEARLVPTPLNISHSLTWSLAGAKKGP